MFVVLRAGSEQQRCAETRRRRSCLVSVNTQTSDGDVTCAELAVSGGFHPGSLSLTGGRGEAGRFSQR